MGEPDQRNGGFLNTTFEDYPITVSADMGEIDVSFIDELDPILNPVGIKGLGEASTGGVALPSSTRSSTPPGSRHRKLPIRIEDVLRTASGPQSCRQTHRA
jgi:xanthine dehydrogenase YagR molybdenum-binding subunit